MIDRCTCGEPYRALNYAARELQSVTVGKVNADLRISADVGRDRKEKLRPMAGQQR